MNQNAQLYLSLLYLKEKICQTNRFKTKDKYDANNNSM